MKPGFAISKEDRIEFTSRGYCPTYGELTKKGVHKILGTIEGQGKVFVDMGSGTGNVILHAWSVHSKWVQTVGIELSKERHEIALKTKKRLNSTQRGRTDFIHGDMLSYSTIHADIIYISNLCFDEKVNRKIGKKLDKEVKPGTIIFVSKPIYITRNHVKTNHSVTQTWGENSILTQYTILD